MRKRSKRCFALVFTVIMMATSVLTDVAVLQTMKVQAATTKTLGLYNSYDVLSSYWWSGKKVSNLKSSNPNVIKCMNNQVIGVSVGSATVSAKVDGKKVKEKVLVKNYESYFALNSVSVSLFEGETYKLHGDKTSLFLTE